MSSFLGLGLSLTLKPKHTTLKIKKTGATGTKPLFLTEPFPSSRLVLGDIRRLVVKPKFVDTHEWLAANAYDFFHQINLFFGTVAEYCTPAACPVMNAGEGVEYYWSESDKKPAKVPAAQYIDLAFTTIAGQIDNEAIFPTKAGAEFPKNFDEIIRLIFKRLFRVLAHIYHAHFDRIVAMQEEGHLNTLFIHFVLFAQEFDLVDKKEFVPMQDLIEELSRPLPPSASALAGAAPAADAPAP